MPQQAEVEGYKLTDKQVFFQQQYKKLRSIQRLLEDETLATQERTKTLRSLWQELSGEFERLQLNVPQEPIAEFDGMEEGTQPAADKGWETGEGVQKLNAGSGGGNEF